MPPQHTSGPHWLRPLLLAGGVGFLIGGGLTLLSQAILGMVPTFLVGMITLATMGGCFILLNMLQRR